MPTDVKIDKAIVGFMPGESGEKLKDFYKKHTGIEINFNGIEHYKNGFKLLLFSIPLGSVTQIGITTAGCAPRNVLRCSSVNEFINWYECVHIPVKAENIEKASIFKTAEPTPIKTFSESEFRKFFEELNLNIGLRFDPFPFTNKCVVDDVLRKNEDSFSVVLYNGLSVRIPCKNWKQHFLNLNTNVFLSKKNRDWEDYLSFLGIKDDEVDYIRRITPDDRQITYNKKYDSEISYICDFINWRLNNKEPFDYPKNWFNVCKELMKIHGGPITCDGDTMVAYMFAAPRCYLIYFTKGKTDKEIADDIFYDNA